MWKLSFLQSSPEDMPYSIAMLLVAYGINFSILFYLIALASGSLAIGFWKAILMLGLITIFTSVSLQIRQLPERLVQTLAGLMSAQSVILVLCVIPYILILSFLSELDSNLMYIVGLTLCSALLIGASMWLFAIYGYIFRSALEISFNAGFIVSLLLFSLITLIFRLMY